MEALRPYTLMKGERCIVRPRYSGEEYLEGEERSNGAEGSSWYLCTGPATAAATRGDDEVRKAGSPTTPRLGAQHAGNLLTDVS